MYRTADEGILQDHERRETDALGYAIEALAWLANYCEANPAVPWVKQVDQSFLDAVDTVLQYLDIGSSGPDHAQVAKTLASHLGQWRNDFDPSRHPLAELGRVFKGDPGAHLEYRGPVFTLTMNEVLEGLTIESIVSEWDLADESCALGLLGLATLVLGAIAEVTFLASSASGANLHTELSRVFSKADNRPSLRGQLANLILAGQALAWGCKVEFIPEQSGKTPDWSASDDKAKLWVECTSRQTTVRPMNDHVATQEAIARAWEQKRGKFGERCSPGLISVDVSGLFVSREYGTILKRDSKLLLRHLLHLPSGKDRHVGVYDATKDLDMMIHESHERLMVGVAASALHSAAALKADIRGIVIYHGQEFAVDVPRRAISRPQRGVLVWRGAATDPHFTLALKLAQPALPLPASSQVPPVFAFLV